VLDVLGPLVEVEVVDVDDVEVVVVDEDVVLEEVVEDSPDRSVVVVEEDVDEDVVEDSPDRSVVVVEEDVVFEDKFMDVRIIDVVSPFLMVVVPVKIVDSVDVDV
jgi:hypothetical protein